MYARLANLKVKQPRHLQACRAPCRRSMLEILSNFTKARFVDTHFNNYNLFTLNWELWALASGQGLRTACVRSQACWGRDWVPECASIGVFKPWQPPPTSYCATIDGEAVQSLGYELLDTKLRRYARLFSCRQSMN
jgi:hypothetical protein